MQQSQTHTIVWFFLYQGAEISRSSVYYYCASMERLVGRMHRKQKWIKKQPDNVK